MTLKDNNTSIYFILFLLYEISRKFTYFMNSSVKVALDGGTRPGDTIQILPFALAQPPNPRTITSHSVLRRHPSLTHRVFFLEYIYVYIYIFFIRICICVFLCVLKLQKNIKSIVNLSFKSFFNLSYLSYYKIEPATTSY